jgi:hypothetical protein
MMTLLREQRRTAEMEFIKQQWVLAELLKQYKGQNLRETELPIPADIPMYPRYRTHADIIARSERTQYLGRMIPIQEQLIESKNATWKAASAVSQNASQPLFAAANQRMTAFLDLTDAIIEYNKMIAEYAMETIPSNISMQQLVGTVVRRDFVATMLSSTPGNLINLDIDETKVYTLMSDEERRELEGRTVKPTAVTAQPIERVSYEYSLPEGSFPSDEKVESEPVLDNMLASPLLSPSSSGIMQIY